MPADPELNAIEEVAAAWVVERDRGLTPAREREFQRWLHADARHAPVFEALAATWSLLGDNRPAKVDLAVAGSAAARRATIRWLGGSLAAAAAVALALLGVGPRADPPVASAPYALTAATEVGAVRRIELPDHSVIQLNTDSAIEVRYEGGERRVWLARGEAHFSVAKDASRPFLVHAAGVNVRVLGTVFNVRLRDDAVDVLVTEGKVRAAPRAGAASELLAGQKLSVALAPAAPAAGPVPVAASPAEIRQSLAWQSRRLDFDAAPLGEIVREINRYNRHQLVVADPRLNERRFGGSFPATDYDTLVRMLETDFAVVAERRGNETWLRLRTP